MSAAALTTESVIATARRARSSHFQSVDGNDKVVRLPEAALTEVVRRVAAAVGSQIRQIVPFSTRRRVMDEFSQLVLGEAGTRAQVQRLYLVPAGHARIGEVNVRISHDREREVEARSLLVGGTAPSLSGESPFGVPMRDVWLVETADHERLVIRQEFGQEGPPDWVVSSRAEDVDETDDLWRSLWEGTAASHTQRTVAPLSDPLLESAPLIHSVAQMSCAGGLVDEEWCGWYHGVWQYLRLFDMVSSPRWHPDFYLNELRARLTEPSVRRVLISGTADYAALAYVLEAAEQRRGEIEIHVIDRCQTPLFACRWYAKRLEADIKEHHTDLLKDESLSGFDLIVTDAFLTRFPKDMTARVVKRWARMLRPGGTVVTTVRLHPRNGELHGVSDDVSEFLLRLRERAENWRWMLKIDLNELLDAGREYALKMTSRDLGDLPEVRDLFYRNGFDVKWDETAEVDGELCKTQYARIVATVREPSREPRK